MSLGLPRVARLRAAKLVETPEKLLRVAERAGRKLAATGGRASLKEVVGNLRTMLRLGRAWAEGRYTEVPKAKLVLVVGALGYFLMPADFIPDLIPVTGFVDDAAVIAWAVRAVREELRIFENWERDACSSEEDGAVVESAERRGAR